MATIDIGKIKPVFKGTYDNSTAYVLDDIVYYNGSSYVAKTSTTGNLPTDNTKWNILASGSGGIWDSTLALGTAGKILQVNSGATALEFVDAPSGVIKKIHTWEKYGRISLSNATGNHFVWTNTNVTTDSGTNFTPLDRVNNDLMIDWQVSSWGAGNNVSNVGIRFTGDTSGTNYDYQHRGHAQSAPDSYSYIHRGHFRIPKNEVVGNGTETFSVYYRAYGAGGHEDYVNPNSSNDGRIGGASPWSGQTSTLQITEFKN